ncbi:hypothetical protein H072_3062 [Dactylellina haptotyla CBS 200.50]|uniref:Vta1/callose synthase N-terminal domain-containing protein n=1 Tax=Dactylellina haptotyla (strain CBS 200.50) TaxID=1284197 RepID=S8AJ67_DACHA|nr:hypothetical protein H072_3062 [Dactylellina haptotyla CBS 200.50]
MASEIPASMKAIAPFVTKAKQMEKADPVVSYYCYVYAVQQALAKNLTKTPEGMSYTSQVMDTLEQRKAELAENEAVTDELVGKIYVEQFANLIFGNAEKAQNARRCTKQTAETFMAAAAFLELLKIFGDLDPEVSQKITFAKYSAARILKALKAGEDPNPPEEEIPEDDPPPPFTDTDIPKLQEVSPVSPVSPQPPGPSVEDTADESENLERDMARMSTADESLHPSRMMTPNNAPLHPSFPSPPETEAPQYTAANLLGRTETMSTTEKLPTPSQPAQSPPGYFPPPYQSHETSVAPFTFDPTLPSAPPLVSLKDQPLPKVTLPLSPPTSNTANLPPSLPPTLSSTLPSAPLMPPKSPPSGLDNFYSGVAAGGAAGAGVGVGSHSHAEPGAPGPSPHWLGHVSLPPQNAPPISHHLASGTTYYYSPPPGTNPHAVPQQPFVRPLSPFQRTPARQPRKLVDPDENPEAIKRTQKWIKWAESALNFDDVPTAVKNLRLALQELGDE